MTVESEAGVPTSAAAARLGSPAVPHRPGTLPARWRAWAGLGAALGACAVVGLMLTAPDAFLVAVAAFVTTNIDGLVALTALLALHAVSGRRTMTRVLLGQTLGTALVVGGSVLASRLLVGLPRSDMVWLACAPIGVGLVALLRRRRKPSRPELTRTVSSRWTTLVVAAIVVSTGGDNVATYTPLFRGLDGVGRIVTLSVFACMTVVWCAAAYALSRAPLLAAPVRRHGLRLVPYGYLGIGAVLMIRSLAA